MSNRTTAERYGHNAHKSEMRAASLQVLFYPFYNIFVVEFSWNESKFIRNI